MSFPHPNIQRFIDLCEAAARRTFDEDTVKGVLAFLDFPPTDEQLAAVEAALTRENLVITAGAGSGKTSTLKLIAFALDLAFGAKGIYIAYNKAIATDAAKAFPANVECRTAHSFAYRAVGYAYRERLNPKGRATSRSVARMLGLDRSFALPEGREIAPSTLAGYVMQTINSWAHSADAKISVKHTPIIPGAEDISFELAKLLVEKAQWAWDTDLKHTEPVLSTQQRTKQRGQWKEVTVFLPWSHDLYVKLWALSGPKLPGKFCLYDEAQDADPCIAGIVLAQTDMQLIAVGDECQAIYGWRGATDAMKNWPAAHRVALTKSFRFGPAVADVANGFLAELSAPLRIVGFEKLDTTVGMIDLIDADAVLCRTNAGVISTALSIHYARKVAVVGGTTAIEQFAKAARDLQAGRGASWHAELGAFKDWADVLDYVENDESGSDIRSMVNMIENFGVETIFEVVGKCVPEGTEGALTISTAHKAKGREWPKVVIHSDFVPPVDPETGEAREVGRPELMLRYVAVTRAKTALDCAALA